MLELVDWHTHCFLHEHRTDEDRALWSQRGVLGSGEALPEQHDAMIDEAGVSRFVVVAIPKHSGNHTPPEFIADYVGRFPGRAVGFCSVHPDDEDAPQEFEHGRSAWASRASSCRRPTSMSTRAARQAGRSTKSPATTRCR